jgi:hypothetical protein
MTDIETSSSDTVRIHAVEFFEKLKGVSEPKAAEQNTIAGGILVAVRHKKDGTDNWGWYFEKGEIRKSLSRGTDLAMFIEGQMAQKPFSDFIRTNPFLRIDETMCCLCINDPICDCCDLHSYTGAR